MQLEQKNLLLGISGGIAAYKTPDLVRKLKAQGANVRVVLTDSASNFVSPLALQAVSGNKTHQAMLDEEAEAGMGHIELARWADVLLIAPATANVIAKLTHGLADDLLTTLALATPAPIVLAPAMNQQMWAAPSVEANIQTLVARGVHILGPAAGEQACGDIGYGRMLEPIDICAELITHFNPRCEQILAGKNLMITAGPTREALDPVRYITNHSSGKMGYALASAAQALGANVTLVSGPVTLSAPHKVTLKKVDSAQQMLDAVMQDIEQQDIFIGCAAVADYRLNDIPTQKSKKKAQTITLELIQNPDILATVAGLDDAPFTLGFAAETQDVEHYAKDKLKRKKLDMIAANDVSDTQIGFNSDNNALTVISRKDCVKLESQSKHSLAFKLLELVVSEWRDQQHNND